MQIVATAFTLALVATSAVAQSSSKQIAFVGLGTKSCGHFLETRAKADEFLDSVMATWVEGFLTGTNVQRYESGRPFVPLPDRASTLAFVDKYCRDNPLKSIVEASIALNRELK
jgi:hypothetical protein